LAKTLRIRQWLKNLAVFAAITFAGRLFDHKLFLDTLLAFLVLCGLSSTTYIFNDLMDIKRDQLHPVKKHRPIASGALTPKVALMAAAFLVFFSLRLAAYLPIPFFFLCILFLLLQFLYSTVLRQIVLLDIFLIASGYVLRVMAGEFATGWHISVWLLLCVISLSLFLAVGKRRAELTLLQSLKRKISRSTRQTLFHYPEKLLDIYTSMFANSTWITYSFFTFFEPGPRPRQKVVEFLLDFFPWGLERKWMMTTIPVVMFGTMRYMQLIYAKKKGEAPEEVLLTDKPLLATVFLWGLMVIGIIYVVGG